MKMDPEMLLQVAILGLLEKGMSVHEVAALTKRTVQEVWVGLNQEKQERESIRSS